MQVTLIKNPKRLRFFDQWDSSLSINLLGKQKYQASEGGDISHHNKNTETLVAFHKAIAKVLRSDARSHFEIHYQIHGSWHDED